MLFSVFMNASGALCPSGAADRKGLILQDLAELNAAWNKLGKIEAHKEWSKELEPHIVSGTPRWEILRVV